MIRARQSRALSPSSPFNWRSAWRRCRSVSAWMRSSRPSASVRSSLPFSKARRVNSPGSAGANIFECRTAPRTKPPAPRARHGREIPRRLRRSRWPDPETTAPPHRRSAAGRHPEAARGWPFAATAICRQAPSRSFRPADPRRAPRRSRSAAGPTTMQRWSDPADAWPICAGGFEKATRFDSGPERAGDTAGLLRSRCCSKMLQNPEKRPPPTSRSKISNIKFNMLTWLTNR